MLDKLFYIGVFIGAICMVFFTPMKCTQGIYLLEYGTLTVKDRLLSFVPLVNIIKAEKLYYNDIKLHQLKLHFLIL